MWKSCSRLVFAALALAVSLGFGTSARAESACDSPDVSRFLPEACQRELITSSGELSYNVIRSAKYLGQKAWQRQVLQKYGERFQRWDLAACPKVECVPGALAGSSRCNYSGFPCSPDVDVRQLADLVKNQEGYRDEGRYDRVRREREFQRELSRDEVLELQALLNRAGFRIQADGDFGEQTSRALLQWQARAGVPQDGLNSFENLDRLRRAVR
jgi:hypothetical protein